MTTTTLRRASAAALALGLLLGSVACSSDGDDAADDPTTTVAPDGSDPGTDEPATDGEEADCTADQEAGSDNLSGSATVLFTADTDGAASDTDITPETTLTVAADGSSMDPSTLTVAANEVFGVLMAPGGSIDGVVIGCAGGQTLVPNVAVGFVITEPGTYPVSLDVAGTDLGSITVE